MTDGRKLGVESEVNESILQRWNNALTYLIYYVDKGLNVSPLETSSNIGHPHARDDRLDDGGKLVPGDSMADQALQGLFIRVENDGWFREVVRAP